MPNISYKIWILAYATKSAFSESDAVTVITYPEPENLILNSTAAYNMTLKWKMPENIVKYVIQYTSAENEGPVEAFKSEIHPIFQTDKGNNLYYFIDDLLPKTKYQFSIQLFYKNAPKNHSYRWPPQQNDDSRYTFETLGDCPGRPGRPAIELIRNDIYKVTWEASRENGAVIEEYYLEAKRLSVDTYILDDLNRVRRFLNETNEISNKDSNDVHLDYHNLENTAKANELNSTFNRDTDITTAKLDPLANDNEWEVVNSGQANFWIVKDLYPVHDYVFRVKAQNSYGWGPYSDISEIYTLSAIENLSNSNVRLKDSNNGVAMLVALVSSMTGLIVVFAVVFAGE